MGLTVGAVSVILSLITISHAFVTPQLAKPPCRAGPNFASSFDDDELSKLIGKRSQIRRKKKEELPSEDSVLEDLGLDEEAPIDLDKMPEFQTKRPVRAPKSSEEEKEEEEPVGRAPAEVTVTDYLADYEDENEFHIPNRIGISTRCWGDVAEGFVASGKLKKQQLREGKFVPGDLQVAFDALLAEGIVLFETSPEYGKAMAGKQLSAEDILARCIKENPHAGISPQIVGTYSNKIIQRSPKALTDALAGSCERMGVDLVDVYQVANLSWLHPSGGLVKGLTEGILEVGQANYAGVKNLSPLRMRRIIQKLDKFDLVLTSNSFEFSLTNRKNEKWITACKALGVIPLCRNPYDGGLASAQYTATNPSGGLAGVSKYSFSQLEKLQPLHSVLESVAEKVKARVIRENRDIKDRSRGRYGPAVSSSGNLMFGFQYVASLTHTRNSDFLSLSYLFLLSILFNLSL